MRLAALVLALTVLVSTVAASLKLTQVGTVVRWRKAEFAVTGLPQVTNPFDSDVIAVDATITSPTGKVITVPAFWYQAYSRSLVSGSEVLKLDGKPGWRLRFTPLESGSYSVSVAAKLPNTPTLTGSGTFAIPDAAVTSPVGYVLKSPNNQSFVTSHGENLPLIGSDVAWYDAEGTYDYDMWFGEMAGYGENFARVWMVPWSNGIETDPGTLLNYRLDHAWQLDYEFSLAEAKGIYIQLCLDYHGMFASVPDYWGGNDYWPVNPYNTTEGGMCGSPDDFFTLSTAQKDYQKRLRYILGRYGYSTHLLAFEFFNELDNVYNVLNASDVATWTNTMGTWLKQQDPYHRLLTDSYVNPNHPEIWSLPSIDIVELHPYGFADPAAYMSSTTASMRAAYGKPVLVAEYGTSGTGWNESTVDPYLRGLRQGVWGGAVSGTAGTAMSWWWENLYSDHVDPMYGVLAKLLRPTTWEQRTWKPVSVPANGELAALGAEVPNGKPFTSVLPLNHTWGDLSVGTMSVSSAKSATRAPLFLNSFIQGSAHPDLIRPFNVQAWFGSSGEFTVHLNSVSVGAVLVIQIDGKTVLSLPIPDIGNGSTVDNQYDIDIGVPVPAGKHAVSVSNSGQDWIYLDWVSVTDALPATYSPTLEAVGSTGASQSLLYVIDPATVFPYNALNPDIAAPGYFLTLPHWPAGSFTAAWFDAASGKALGSTTATTGSNGALTLSAPTISSDAFVEVKKT